MMLHRTPWLLPFIGILASTVLTAVVLLTDWPLGSPGNWVWNRIVPFDPDIFGLLLPLGLLFGIAAWCAWHLRRGRGAVSMVLAAGIMLCGIWGDCLILRSGRMGAAESVLAVLNPFTTGYLNPDWTRADMTHQVIPRILTVPGKEVPHHRHVHPPCNIYLSRLISQLPGNRGRGLMPETYRQMSELKNAGVLLPPLDTDAMIETALKTVLIFLFAVESGKILLALMLWKMKSVQMPGPALLTVAFGSGSAMLFLGHYDVFYFFLTSLILFCTGLAVRRPVFAGCAGFLVGWGGGFSLGFGPVGGLCAGTLLVLRKRGKTFAWFAVGGLVTAGLLTAIGLDLPAVFLKCLENHHRFQTMTNKSYGVWSLLNILDALFFCGVLPSIILFFTWRGREKTVQISRIALFFWCFVLFSGGVRGELGRLACVYLPVLLLALGRFFGAAAPPRIIGLRIFAVGMMLLQTAVLRNALKLILID